MDADESDLTSSGEGMATSNGNTSSSAGEEATAEPGFDTVWRGFAPDQVKEHLDRLATSVMSLEARLRETRSELLEAQRERDDARGALERAVAKDPYEGLSERVTELVRGFDQDVERLRRDAEGEADRTVAEVRAEADRIVANARAEAARIVEQAQTEAEATRAKAQEVERDAQARAGTLLRGAQLEAHRVETDLAAKRETTLSEFREIRERTLAALGQLDVAIEGRSGSDEVVVVDEAEGLESAERGPMPRPDL